MLLTVLGRNYLSVGELFILHLLNLGNFSIDLPVDVNVLLYLLLVCSMQAFHCLDCVR